MFIIDVHLFCVKLQIAHMLPILYKRSNTIINDYRFFSKVSVNPSSLTKSSEPSLFT